MPFLYFSRISAFVFILQIDIQYTFGPIPKTYKTRPTILKKKLGGKQFIKNDVVFWHFTEMFLAVSRLGMLWLCPMAS